VNNSDYAGTLQADHVEANVPMKSSKIQEASKTQESGPSYNSAEKVSHSNRPKALSADKVEVTRHTIGGPEAQEYAQNEARFDPVPRTSGRQGQGQVAPWLETNGPSSTGSSMGPVVPPTVTSSASGQTGDGVVPRSQSAGPTTGTGSRRGDPSRIPPGSQQLLMSLRGSNANNTLNIAGGSHSQVGRGGVDADSRGLGSQAGNQQPKTVTTPHPPRSVSVHPLHRTESQKKHAMGKAEDQPPEKSGPPGRAQSAYSGPPLRRSLPAKTSGGYAPLSRAPSGGGSTHTGITRDITSISGGGSSHGGGPGSGGSGLGSANTTASVSRQPPQNSPRSPGSVSPVLMGQENQVGSAYSGNSTIQRPNQGQQEGSVHTPTATHSQVQNGRSNSHPRVTSAPAGPGRYAVGNPTGSMSSASRVATPPVPLTSGHLASHSGPPGQVGSTLSKTQQSSRGASPGSLAGMGHQHQNVTTGGQPTRASSAPRVSGLTGHGHHHNHATPPGSSSVRTAASQPVGQGGPPGQSRMTGHGHVPGSPSLNSPMTVPHSFGGSSSGTGASVVVFPASPTTRGSSPSPALSMVGATMPIKAGRGTIGSTSGLQRNASPMGIPQPASPAGTMSPAGNMPLGSMNISGNRPDPLSSTRGRSPPPGIAGNNTAPTARAPRAVTPGQIVKSIQQGTSGNIARNSFGGAQMVMHRGGLG
jgi:hypothetical protein